MSKPTKLTKSEEQKAKNLPKAKNKKRKTYQRGRTAYRKSRGLDKHGKKPSSEDQAFEKDV